MPSRHRASLFVLLVGVIFTAGRIASAADPDPALSLDLGNGVKLDAVYVQPGTFTQGSPESEAGRNADETPREVTIGDGFYIGKTAVMRQQWERFVAETHSRSEAETGKSGGFGWDGAKLTQARQFNWKSPGFTQSSDDPVCIITFADAKRFCAWLARKTGRRVDLPTEAQWEYACRAGTKTPWHNGASDVAGAGEVVWSKQNAGDMTRPVTSTKPNAWGIYIGGNVSEWCQDFYGPYPPGDAKDPVQAAPPAGDKPRRVLRGGSWNREGKNTRSAARFRADPGSRNADIGFRVIVGAQVPVAPPPPSPPAASVNPPGEPSNDALPQQAFPQSSYPNPAAPSAPFSTPPARSSWGVPVLACLVVGLGIIGFIAFKVLRAIARPMGESGTPRGFPISPARLQTGAATSSRPVGAGAGVRLAEDGFWLLLNVAAGSRVHYAYRVPSSIEEASGSVTYQPGGEGQFVYTGAAPQFARVTQVDPPMPQDPGAMGAGFVGGYTTSSTMPPPLPMSRNGSRGSSSIVGGIPPHRPSAY